MKSNISIIGAGKVGNTLARLWYTAGVEIKAVYNRNYANAEQLAEYVDADAVDTLEKVINSAEIIFLTVADDALSAIANELAKIDLTDKAIVHTSGALSIDIFSELALKGASLGSLHPAFPFSDIESAMKNLSGASFAIEASDEKLQRQLIYLAELLGGKIIIIPEGQKAIYHASLVLISNYTVTLYSLAENMLKPLTSDQSAIDSALMTLLRATVENIANQGIPDALTGPLVRADGETIQGHLQAIDDDALKSLYISLARLSYPMLEQRGINTHFIDKYLQDEE